MAITFNPQIKMASSVSFKQNNDIKAETPPATTPPALAEDVVQKQTEIPKKNGLADFSSKIAYAWINATEMTKGVVSGIFAGAAAGTAVAGTDWLVSGLKETFNPRESAVLTSWLERFKTMFKHPTKVLGVVGKIVAPIVAVAFFAGNIISARLNANKKTANVDHQLYTNHRADQK